MRPLSIAVALYLLSAAPVSDAASWHLAGAVNVSHVQPAAHRAQRVSMDAGWNAGDRHDLVLDVFGTTLGATRTAFEKRNDGWMWQGRLDTSPDHAVSLTMHRGVLAGLVQTPLGRYEIVPLPEGGSALVDLDTKAFPGCGGGLEAEALARYPAKPAPRSPAAKPTVANAPIDVLVVYSPQVLAAMGSLANVEAEIHAAVDTANLAFANSDMTARFSLAGIRQFPRDEVDVYDLEWLRVDPAAIAMRDEVGADLASLWVEHSLTVCGAGFIMDALDDSFAGDAVQITMRSCAVGDLVYAHEHGHNLGMQHDPAYGAPSAWALFPWAFGHYVDDMFTTVMSYPYDCAGYCARAAHFSNPEILYLGQPTGIADQRDNHRVGNVTAPIIAGFRPRAKIFADGFE